VEWSAEVGMQNAYMCAAAYREENGIEITKLNHWLENGIGLDWIGLN